VDRSKNVVCMGGNVTVNPTIAYDLICANKKKAILRNLMYGFFSSIIVVLGVHCDI
jgi:hypothetical protein